MTGSTRSCVAMASTPVCGLIVRRGRKAAECSDYELHRHPEDQSMAAWTRLEVMMNGRHAVLVWCRRGGRFPPTRIQVVLFLHAGTCCGPDAVPPLYGESNVIAARGAPAACQGLSTRWHRSRRGGRGLTASQCSPSMSLWRASTMIVGHGIDIADVAVVRRWIDEPTDPFLSRAFRQSEPEMIPDGPNRPARVAGRFAAKEAVLKALGVGVGNGIALTDVAITSAPSGAPKVQLSKGAKRVAQQLGGSEWHLSISHVAAFAIASVIAVGCKHTDENQATNEHGLEQS